MSVPFHTEDQDSSAHPHVAAGAHLAQEAAAGSPGAKAGRKELSIWFFCGILMLFYGLVLIVQGVYEHFGHQPNTILANLEPTLWWGVCLTVFGAFYTVRFRPGKG